MHVMHAPFCTMSMCRHKTNEADAEIFLGVLQAVGQALALALGILFIVIQVKIYLRFASARTGTTACHQAA